jgi:tape measure domain-containing protein
MSSIRTAIELYDSFSAPMMSIVNAVSLGMSAITDFQSTMNDSVSFDVADTVTEQMNQAVAAIEEARAKLAEPVTHENTSIAWESPIKDTFTTSGIERFQQEVQSTNTMLEQLSSTQMQIATQADRTAIFPQNMVTDMTNMQNRMQAIQQRIQQIESNPLNLGTDTANGELEHLRSQLSQALQEQNRLNSAMDNMDVNEANQAYNRLSNTVGTTERYIRDNTDAQGQFNNAIRDGTSAASGLESKITGLVAAYATVQTVENVLGISDELTMTTARIDLMNDGLQSTNELVNMVYASAQNARGSFSDMASVVARFGNNAKDAFSGSAEVVAFTNLVQKQMTIAGASTTEASNAMLQLSQALGSGVLRGDELNSIFEQAPNLIQNIADYLDVPIGKIREMASNSELSANIVKAAIFAASDDINAKFEQMPMTWGQAWQSMKNTAIMEFQPVLQRINDIANSEGFQTFVNGAIEAMATLANIVLNIFDVIGQVGGFIADNWSMISPIILGAAAAWGVYTIAVNSAKIAEMAQAVWTGITTAAKVVATAATWLFTSATLAQAGAQWGLNAAMYACPIVWIIILIIALIAIFYLAVAAINHFAGTSISATGVIAGAFLWLMALIGNIVIGTINAIIQFIWTRFVEPFIDIIEWVLNVANGGFDSFGGAVANLIGQIISWFMSLGKIVTKIIDAIFGTDWTSGLNSLQDSVLQWGKNENAITLDRNAPGIDYRFDMTNAWDKGYNGGSGLTDTLNNLFNTEPDSGNNYDPSLASAYDNIATTADNTGKMADSVNISDEDLKSLHDVAEREAINRYTTREVKVEMTNYNNVNKDRDLDGIVDYLRDALEKDIDVSAEGVG